MNSYTFQVKLEPDEEGWRAYYRPLEEIGASTWGETPEKALNNIQEVLSMIVDEFHDRGQPLPEDAGLTVSDSAAVTVNL